MQGATVDVTVDGISVSVEREAMNDIDVVEWLGDMQDGNIFVFPKLCKRVFGDQYKEVKEALADESGRTTADAVMSFFLKLMSEINALEAKN